MSRVIQSAHEPFMRMAISYIENAEGYHLGHMPRVGGESDVVMDLALAKLAEAKDLLRKWADMNDLVILPGMKT